MIIKKNGSLSKILKEVLKGNRTGNVSTLVNDLIFEKGERIILYFSEGIDRIEIKDESVDFDGRIANSFIITALASELEKKDVVILGGAAIIRFNDYEFENNYNLPSKIIKKQKSNPFITFNQEQFKNLEKDFELTIGNYFKLSKATDVICFAFNEGKLYKLLPGCNVYEISNFDGTIDNVQLEQDFGHFSCIYIMPHKIFDFMKNEQNISVSYKDDYIYFESNEITVVADFGKQLGTNAFINKLSIINEGDKIATLKDFSSIKEKIKNISSNLFEESEIPSIFIKVENEKIGVEIEDTRLSFNTELKNFITFNVNLLALNYVLQNLPEDTTILKNNYYLIFKSNNRTIYLINKEI